MYIYRNIFFSALININRKIAYRCVINSRGVLQNLLHTAPFRQFSFDITNPFLLHVLIGCKDLNFSMHHSILTTVYHFRTPKYFTMMCLHYNVSTTDLIEDSSN